MMSPLQSLEGRALDREYKISLEIKPRSYVEQSYFEVYLIDKKKRKSKNPVFEGIYSQGRESARIRGWVDGDYFEEVEFPEDKINLAKKSLDEKFFKILSQLVPPGGSLMVSYEMFYGKSKIHEETEKGLNKGFPPESTPLGYLLFKASCGLGMKNWYIAEGGMEGNPKIQGFKALNKEHREERVREIKRRLKKFIKESGDFEIEKKAKDRAKKILEELPFYK